MLAVIPNESIETKDIALKELRRRAAIAKRASSAPRRVRYAIDFQERAVAWAKASGLSLRDAASALGVSSCTMRRWLKESSAFRLVDIVDVSRASTAEAAVEQPVTHRESGKSVACIHNVSVTPKGECVRTKGCCAGDQSQVAEISVGSRVIIRVDVSALQLNFLAALAQL